MPRKFLYFINPISGIRRKSLLTEIIKKKSSEKGIPFEICSTNAEGDYVFLKEKISQEKITDIIICGGDGTVNKVAGALLGIDVNIGIIPLGSGNGLALAAKIPRRIDRALDLIFKGNAVYIDSFYINDHFSCMLCGLGFDAQVAHDFANQKKRGLTTYVRQSIRNFLRAPTYPFTVIMEGREFVTDAFFISIANSNQFGNNFTIAPQASLYDGLVDVVVVNKMSKLRMVGSVLKQILVGQVRLYEDIKYKRNKVHYFHACDLTILNPGGAPLHIDGDPATTAGRLEVRVIPKAFRLIIP